jgi:hypothetical protein
VSAVKWPADAMMKVTASERDVAHAVAEHPAFHGEHLSRLHGSSFDCPSRDRSGGEDARQRTLSSPHRELAVGLTR